jgi:glutaminyl-peptide cyclotransferase
VREEGARARAMRAVLRPGLWLVVLAFWLLACAGSEPTRSSGLRSQGARHREYSRNPAKFSAGRAWHHVEVLTRIGERSVGTRANSQARNYLRSKLTKLGAEVREFPLALGGEGAARDVEAVHIVGVLPGASRSAVLLAAHYDTASVDGMRLVGANDGASGPALVLELGRVLARAENPYTIWLVLLDGEAVDEDGTTGEPAYLGSRSLAIHLFEHEAELAQAIRVGIFFNQVCDSELTIARDLNSHSVYRDLFWEVGDELGGSPSFASDETFRLIRGSHLGFREAGLRGVVAIADDQLGPGLPPGEFWRTEQDELENCSAASFEQVGRVSSEAIARIMQRLARIDQFAASPWSEIEPRVGDTPPAAHTELPPVPGAPADPTETP